MLLIAVASLLGQRVPPEDLVKALVSHYLKLKSYSAKVIHHGDFISDVKDSIDTLSWLGPKRFELTSNKESVPKITCDGRRIITIIPQVAPIPEPYDAEAQRVAPWESRGGIVLSLMMRGPMAQQMFKPSKPVKASFAYGKELRWHDLPISEIVETITAQGATVNVSYYLSPDYKQIVGMESSSGPEHIWTQYTEVKENPELPKTLGNAG